MFVRNKEFKELKDLVDELSSQAATDDTDITELFDRLVKLEDGREKYALLIKELTFKYFQEAIDDYLKNFEKPVNGKSGKTKKK